MQNEKVLVLDFGGQYNQLIARRVRECHVYCEVKSYKTTMEEIRAFDPVGIIFTGGPNSVYEEGSPQVSPEIFTMGVPILGICYGCQLMAHSLGGRVTAAQDDTAREYGKTETFYDTDFQLVAHSAACPNVAICDESRGFYGVQYHPEVNHTEHGRDMIRNFLYEVCHVKGDWTMGDFMRTSIDQIREKVGDYKWGDWTYGDFYTYRPAMAYMLNYLQLHHPNVSIYFIINDGLRDDITESSKVVCDHYGVPYIMLKDIDKQNGHPTIKGMRQIADQVKAVVK